MKIKLSYKKNHIMSSVLKITLFFCLTQNITHIEILFLFCMKLYSILINQWKNNYV